MEIDDLIVSQDKSKAFAEVSKKLAEKNDKCGLLRAAIFTCEEILAIHQASLRKLEEDEMPGLLDEIGVSAITLTNGVRIYIDNSIHVSIAAVHKEEALKWLKDAGHGDLIKNEFNVKFNRNEGNLVGEFIGKAEELGLKYDNKEAVNTMTLKAFVKEQLKAGVKIPSELFGVFIKRIVKTK